MPLHDILWENDEFLPREPVWWLEGTAYTEEGQLVIVKYRIPDEDRTRVLKGEQVNLLDVRNVDQTKFTLLDQQGNAL